MKLLKKKKRRLESGEGGESGERTEQIKRTFGRPLRSHMAYADSVKQSDGISAKIDEKPLKPYHIVVLNVLVAVLALAVDIILLFAPHLRRI